MDGGLADHGEVVTDGGHDQPVDLLVGRSREQLGTGGRSLTVGASGNPDWNSDVSLGESI
jgi:hypothetical protein